MLLSFVMSLGMKICLFILLWELSSTTFPHVFLLNFGSGWLIVQLAFEWFVDDNGPFLDFIFFWTTLIFHKLLVIKPLWCFLEMRLRLWFPIFFHRHFSSATLSMVILFPRLILLSTFLTLVNSLVFFFCLAKVFRFSCSTFRFAFLLVFSYFLPLFHIFQIIVLM